MLHNIIIFFIVLVVLTVILRYSGKYKENFSTFPDSDYDKMIELDKQKFNHLTNLINLTNPQLEINSDTSTTLQESTNHILTIPTSRNFVLDSKNNYDVPSELPQGLLTARSCQQAPKTCAAFDDSEFAMNCGMSFDKNGMNSEGKPYMGGLFVSFSDRQQQTVDADNVIAKGSAPYDPYKVYKPTLGKAAPGTFSLTKDQCVIVKEKVDCNDKQSFKSPNCSECLTSQTFSRVDPNTPRIPFTLSLIGNGSIQITSPNNNVTLNPTNLNPNQSIDISIPSDSEGKTFDITVKDNGQNPTYLAGCIQGQTARGVFKLDLNNMVQVDKITNAKPRLMGTKTVNGFRSISMIPGNKQTSMILSCLVPFSFISMYETDSMYCDNGPYITKEESAVFLESNPCFNKKNKPGNYSLECLQSRWISLGGTTDGTGYPSTQQKADALQKDPNSNPLTIDDIMDQLSIKMNKAITGVDSNGVELSISEWNDLSMWGLGIPIESPCDGINKDSGPLSQRCLSYLYRNKGTTSHIGSTYTMSSKNSSMKEGFADPESKANRYNYPDTELDPKTQSGLNKATNLGGVNAVKQTYDTINRIANDNTKSNSERSKEIKQAYGVQLNPPSSNEIKGSEQVFAVGPGYDYKKEEAEAICMKYGAKVATTQQLTDAQKNGADWCFSGWVSDSNTGKWPITTSVVGGCGGRRGIIEWTPDTKKAGVNCYGPKPPANQYPEGTIKSFNGDLWDQPTKPTYVTIKSGYLETSGPQPSCFSGLSPDEAKRNCDNLGQQCAGFSYSKDGTGNGCYKGNLDAGINSNPNYMGYVKIPPSSTSMIQGRYIRLQYNHQECLNLAQILVYSKDGGPNIITANTSVTKSSGYQGDMFPSKNFVNQNGTAYYNFVHTSCYDVPWIEVDLGSVVPIYKIVVWNRVDCCQSRVLGTVLSILNNDKEMVYLSNPINSVNASYTWLPPNGEVFLDRDPMPPPPAQKVYGNNGTTSCDQYCRGVYGGPWNGELPAGWNGAKCVGHSPNVPNCFSGFQLVPGSYCLCEKTNWGWDRRGWRGP
jgi:Extracellular link domain